jgi:hypothetical protein
MIQQVTLAGVCALAMAGATLPTRAEDSRDFDVHKIKAEAALGALRTIAGVARLEIVDTDTVRAWGTPAELDLAKVVIEFIETSEPASAVAIQETGDDTIVARVVLENVSTKQAIGELRKLQVRRFVVIEAVSAVLIRGTKEEVETAVQALEALEHQGRAASEEKT